MSASAAQVAKARAAGARTAAIRAARARGSAARGPSVRATGARDAGGAGTGGLGAGPGAGLGAGGLVQRPASYTPRRTAGLTGYERVLVRAGLGPVAGIDEAGRGACAGPLVVAAVALDRWAGAKGAEIADSKALTARARESAYREIVRSALAWHVVVIEPGEIDRLGLHVCNVAGMRRALAGLAATPGYVLTDGFEVPGLAVPALAMWKGDQVAACVAAASIIAKVTRDKIMSTLSGQYPEYGFARHKGYSTPSHMAALEEHGPCPVHRRSFVNVSSRLGGSWRLDWPVALDASQEGPIVELTTGSPGSVPREGRGECGDERSAASWEASSGASAELAALAPASSEGRT